jgi:hypothetical protein
MIAGSSTGGVLAAALACPTNEFKNETFPVGDVLQEFRSSASSIFKTQHINYGLLGIITAVSVMMGAVFGLKRGNKRYNNKKTKKTIKHLKKLMT